MSTQYLLEYFSSYQYSVFTWVLILSTHSMPGHCDLYFMVQWFYWISWKLFSGWTSYFGIMSQYDPTYDLQIFVGHYDVYFMVLWICPLSWRLFDVWTLYFSDYESVWHDIWPQNKCRSLWPIFHGPVLVFDEWMSYFWKTSQFNTTLTSK